MALKNPLWLLGKALTEERNRTPLAHLAAKALDLGLRKTDSTRGHMFQAIGGAQAFLLAHPEHIGVIAGASPLEPYKPKGKVLKSWCKFLGDHEGLYGNKRFGYKYDTLKGYLTKKYGGTRTGGGGGDNELEIALRLCAEFMS